MTIIPAIDIINGKCVRLTKGDYNLQTIYNEDPLEVAKEFEDHGIKRLHLVDLDGAKAGMVRNWKVLELIAGKTDLLIDFSGGISSENDLAIAFNSGAAYASLGSMVVKDEILFEEWLHAYGVDRFIIGADVLDEKIMIRGWTESTTISIFQLIEKNRNRGIEQFFCTDISKDGVMEGPSIALYKKIIERFKGIQLIASGGVSKLEDIVELEEAGCTGVIIGKAIYENRISLQELKTWL